VQDSSKINRHPSDKDHLPSNKDRLSFKPNYFRLFARIFSLVWAGFWMWYGAMSAVEDELPLLGVYHDLAWPGLVFFASAIVPWRWERAGGIILIVVSVLLFIIYPVFWSYLPLDVKLLTLLVLAVPPMVSGILFVIARRK